MELFHSFRFLEILNQFTLVGTCIVINMVYVSKIGCIFAFLVFFITFVFEIRYVLIEVTCSFSSLGTPSLNNLRKLLFPRNSMYNDMD